MIKLLVILLLIISCAMKPTKQAQELFNDHENVPNSGHINNVPFIAQSEYFCGPATLASVLQFKEIMDTPSDLASNMMTKKSRGTYPEDMLGAVRRKKLIALKVNTLKNLIKEIIYNHPVIVFQNLGLDSTPMWHYSVVVGYNLEKKEITLHYGDKISVETFYDFEWAWAKGGYWGMIVLSPGELAASADDLENTAAASELERMNFIDEAATSYEAILVKWPTSLGALIGLGNVRFSQREYDLSVRALKMAVREHPTSASAWHNLALGQEQLKEKREAKESAKEALRLASDEQKGKFKESLKSLLK